MRKPARKHRHHPRSNETGRRSGSQKLSETKSAQSTHSTLAAPEDWLFELFGAVPAASGESVTPQNAMRCAAVRRAVQAIAEPIGQLPLHVYRRNGQARERDREHPVAKVLLDPCSWTSSSDFREQMQRDTLLHGNGYAFINRVGGKPVELIRIDPAAVEIVVDKVTGEPSYRTKNQAQERTYAAGDMFHIRAPSLDGYRGVSIVRDCREAIGIALVLEQHVARLFGSGARPGGVIEFPGKLGDEGLKRMRAAWAAAHEGAGKTGRTAILWDGAKFSALTLTSVDAQLLELRKYAVDEIARAFGVPPHLLFEMGRATWGNSAELGSNFVAFALSKWIKHWQGEIRLKLFAPEERDDVYAEFLVDDLLKSDIATRFGAYSMAIKDRVYNPNEVRAMENRAPYEGGDQFANPNITTKKEPGDGSA